MIKILIVDDHVIVRRGLKQIIADEPDLALVAEAATGLEGLEAVRWSGCDVVLLDISLPDRNGLEVLKEIKAQRPTLPVLMLSIYPEDQLAERSLKAGASGYLNKNSASEELVKAIREVFNGKRYVSEQLARSLAGRLYRESRQPLHEALSDREYEVLLLIATGKSISEIAAELMLSPKTISTYRARVLDKLGLTNNIELVRYALEQHLIS